MDLDQKTIDSLTLELSTLSVDLEVATHRQLTILRTLEPTQLWGNQHARSFAHWLSWRIGLATGAAREKTRFARALGGLEAIDAAYEKRRSVAGCGACRSRTSRARTQRRAGCASARARTE